MVYLYSNRWMFIICIGTGKLWTDYRFFPPQIVYKQLLSVMIWWAVLHGWFSKTKKKTSVRTNYLSVRVAWLSVYCFVTELQTSLFRFNKTAVKSNRSTHFILNQIVTRGRGGMLVLYLTSFFSIEFNVRFSLRCFPYKVQFMLRTIWIKNSSFALHHIKKRSFGKYNKPIQCSFHLPQILWCYASCWRSILFCCSILVRRSIHEHETLHTKLQRLNPEHRWTVT